MSDPKIPKAQKVTDEYGEIWWAYEANEIDEYLKSISTKPSHPLPAPTQLPPLDEKTQRGPAWLIESGFVVYVIAGKDLHAEAIETFARWAQKEVATSGKEGE